MWSTLAKAMMVLEISCSLKAFRSPAAACRLQEPNQSCWIYESIPNTGEA